MPSNLRTHLGLDLLPLLESFTPIGVPPGEQIATLAPYLSIPPEFKDPELSADGAGLGLFPAAPWQLEVIHTGPLLGIEATGRQVTITGISILQPGDADGDGDDVSYRVIDWMSVLAQLGISVAPRNVHVPAEPSFGVEWLPPSEQQPVIQELTEQQLAELLKQHP